MSGDLFQDYSAIVEAAEEFVAALKRTPRISMDEVSRRRVKLSSLIRKHRATEEEFIFGPLTREGGFGKWPHLERHVQELMREKVRYTEHVRKWTPQAIQQDWNGYVAAIEMLVDGAKRMIYNEESSVCQVVLSLAPAMLSSRHNILR